MKAIIFLWFILLSSSISGQYHPDRHNTSYNAGWISCETRMSPNTNRETSHWIMYDFGEVYSLGKTTIWNSNVPEFTSIGIKTMEIDYSMDGVTWGNYGSFDVSEANASAFYTGTDGPDLSGIQARYLLITAIDNHGGDCVGFSEIRIQTKGIISNTINVNALEAEVRAFPNPFEHTVTIGVNSIEKGIFNYQVTDMSGRVILRGSQRLDGIPQNIVLQGNHWSPGMYTFTLQHQGKLKSITLEKTGR